LEFAILTAARPGEVLVARWPEVDLEAKIGTVPGARMKGGRAHQVPLSPRCVTLCRARVLEEKLV
jgi:integrase